MKKKLNNRQKKLKLERRLKRKTELEMLELHKRVCLKLWPLCLLCEKPASVVHHYRPQGAYAHMKALIENGISLCAGCHFRLHIGNNALQDKIRDIKGSIWYSKINRIGNETPANYKTLEWYQKQIKYLKGVLKRL
jgi:hypothetical protein